MKKKGIGLYPLIGLILGAVFLIVLITLSYKLLPSLKENDCSNQNSWEDIKKSLEGVEKGDIPEKFFINSGCYLVSFNINNLNPSTLSLLSGTIKPDPLIVSKQKPAICLCKSKELIDDSICIINDLSEDCYFFENIQDFIVNNEKKQLNTGTYLLKDKNYIFLNFEKQGSDLLINYDEINPFQQNQNTQTTTSGTSTSNNQVTTNTQSNSNVNDITKVMEYARTNKIYNKKCYCKNQCGEYANWIVKYSSEYGISDPLLIVSLMMQESECSSGVASSSSNGLMQINCKYWVGRYGLSSNIDECKKFLINHPEENIKIGIIILKNYYNQYGSKGINFKCNGRTILYSSWEAALRAYNGIGCTSDQDYFVEEVMKRYNKLKETLVAMQTSSTTG